MFGDGVKILCFFRLHRGPQKYKLNTSKTDLLQCAACLSALARGCAWKFLFGGLCWKLLGLREGVKLPNETTPARVARPFLA